MNVVSEEERKKRDLKKRKTYMERWPDRLRATFLKRVYKLSWDDYMSMYNKQQGCCAMCNSPMAAYRTKETTIAVAHVDHCHETGKVRDLLCMGCNRGIGYLRDNLDICKAAVSYLERHQPT